MFIAHSWDTAPFIRKKAQGATHSRVRHWGITGTLKELLGVIMGEKRKKEKQKPRVSFSIAVALFWSTGEKGRSLPDALSVHVWRVFQGFRLSFTLGWLMLEGKMINSPLVQEEFKVWSPSRIRLLLSMVRVLRNPVLPFYPSLIIAFSERDRMECFTPTCL